MFGYQWRHGLTAMAVALAATAGAAGPKAAVNAAPSSREVHYAPAPAWVTPPPAASEAPTPPGAPARVIYVDQQVRIGAAGQDSHEAYRLKVLTPEALGAGNITISWAPADEVITVNRLAIIRDGKPIDVLATQKFAVIQRESNLEQAMLDGTLTATLQAVGLQVGDELEFAVTKVGRPGLAGERPQDFMQFPMMGVRGAWRMRVLQPKASTVAYRASPDLAPATVSEIGGETERRYELADPASVVLPDGAPPRYAIARLIQYTGYEDWAAVSRTFEPLFTRAAILAPGSAVKAEAARIAAEAPDPARRAEAALRAVEDRIRYVYVGLEGGNYRPAGADETWQRRFGDCKAKTVLLIAMLRELGITAEAVLVATNGGDGIDARLPTPAVFNHVLVKATVDGKPYWLDGTRMGDRRLADLPPPPSSWGLPLRAAGAALTPIAAEPPRYPVRIQAVDIDASAGFDKPGKYRVQYTLRGDDIFAMRAQLAGVAPADANRLLAAFWRGQMSDVEPTETGWRFDDDHRLLVLTMTGEGKVDWDGDDAQGHTHYLFGAGFTPPDEMKRPKDQPQDAAWATDYPAFTCYGTTVRVPAAGKGFHWSSSSNPVDRTLGGIAYWRIASFGDGVMRIVKSRRVDQREISAAEATTVNAAIKGFDNNKSYVFETKGKASVKASAKAAGAASSTAAAGGFGSFEDFAGAAPPCQSPARH